MSEICWCVDLGCRSFADTWELQRLLVARRQNRLVPDVLLLVEHPPTYTLGRGGKREHLLLEERALAGLGAVYLPTDRGGDITYHGPGQIVGYPILDLNGWKKDVHAYLRALEEVLILTLRQFDIEGRREAGLTGVWHPRGKLASIGVRVSRWITSHGFALNVTTNLEYFKHIVPCGIVGREVSSMQEVLRSPVALASVRDALARSFGEVFSRRMREATAADLEDGAH